MLKRLWLGGLLVAMCLMSGGTSTVIAHAGGWQPVTGPNAVSVTALVVSPNYGADSTVFVGLRGHGVYRTTNDGRGWQPAGLSDQVIIALAISPAYATDHTVFAAAGLPTTGYTIYRTTDGGATWQAPAVTPYGYGFNILTSLSISPDYANDHTVYALGAETYQTNDGGLVFTKSGGWFAMHPVTHLAYSPAYATDHTLFAAVQNDNVYRSTNGGEQFDSIGLGDVSALAVSPNYASDQIVAAITSVDGQLHWSVNQGTTWTPGTLMIGVGGQHNLLFSPTFASDQMLLVASSNDPGAYQSSDGGATWMPFGRYDPSDSYQGFAGGAAQALALAPTMPDGSGSWAFVGTRSGLYRSPAYLNSWERLDTGLPRATVRSLAISAADPARWLVGTSYFDHVRFDGSPGEWDGNLQLVTYSGQPWRDVTGELDRVNQVAFSPDVANDHTALACTGVIGQHGYVGGSIYRSIDDGQSWAPTISTTVCLALAFSPDVAVDHTVWAASSSGPLGAGLLRSEDGGAHWSLLTASVAADRIVPSPNYAIDHTLLAATQDGHLQKSIDGGATWTPILPHTISALALSPAYGASQRIYAAVKDSALTPAELYRSDDGGATWTVVVTGVSATTASGNLNIASLNFAFDGSVLLGVTYGDGTTGAAVYRSIDGGVTWTALGGGLEAYQLFDVTSMANTFFAATSGGLWRIDLSQHDPTEPGTWTNSTPRGGRADVLAVSPNFVNDGFIFSGEVNVSKATEYGPGMVKSSDWGQTWRSVGGGGAVHGYTFSPNFTVDHTMFALTSGDLLKSTDGGSTWQAVNNISNWVPGMRALALAPDYLASGHMIATSVWATPFMSRDFGQTWTNLPANIWGEAAYSLNFAADGTIFMSGYSYFGSVYMGDFSVYRSIDRGLNWTHVLTTAGAVSLSPQFGADHVAFVAGRTGVSKTLDSGVTWTTIYSTPLKIFISPEYGSDHALYGLNLYGDNLIYRSPDGGATWSTIPVGTASLSGLIFSPAFGVDHLIYATSSDGLYRSTDGGLNWSAVPYLAHRSISALAFSPSWPTQPYLLAGTPGGVYRSIDGGTSWARMQGFRALATTPLVLAENDSLWLTGTDTGVYTSADQGVTWSPLPMALPSVTDLAVSPVYASDRTLFAITRNGAPSSEIQRSTDGGETWQLVRYIGGDKLAISPQFASDHTIYALNSGQVMRSIDGGDNWDSVGTWPPNAWPAQVIALPPNYPDDSTIFVAGSGFWRLPPGETAWQPAASGIVPTTRVAALAIAPNYSTTHTLLAGIGDYYHPTDVLRSEDGGVNWQPSNIDLPHDWGCNLAFSPNYATDHTVYLISFSQLYRSMDDGHSWTLIGAPPGGPQLTGVVVTHAGQVIVSSGAGLWAYTTGFRDILINGSFTANSGWTLIGDTAYTSAITYDDSRALRIGPANGANIPLDSAAVQTVTIPNNATLAQLSMRVYPVSGETQLNADAQYATLTISDTTPISHTLFWMLSNAQTWQHYSFDLTPYAGQTLALRLGVINDGQDGQTALMVDNTSLITVGHRFYLPLLMKN